MLTLPHPAPCTLPQATVDPRHHQRLLDTHRQVWVSLVWGHCPFLLGPGDARFCLCPPRVCFSSPCRFCNQILLTSKVKFSGGFQSFCQSPRLGNLLWVLELSYQCENFFDIIVLQFVGHLLHSSVVGSMATSSKRACAAGCVTSSPALRAPALVPSHC